MRVSWRAVGLLIALIAGVAVMTLMVAQLIQRRPVRPIPPAPLVEPVTKAISADLDWQNKGVRLESGDTIKVQFMSGEIRDGDAVVRGPAGAGYVCGDSGCCEPMPEVERDALIGRVGDDLFLIGDRNTIEMQEGGELQLRINDCDEGLFDNSGSLTVPISP